jgi:hypothetical protein
VKCAVVDRLRRVAGLHQRKYDVEHASCEPPRSHATARKAMAMTVQQLLAKLNRFEPELTVLVISKGVDDAPLCFDIEEIAEDRGELCPSEEGKPAVKIGQSPSSKRLAVIHITAMGAAAG